MSFLVLDIETLEMPIPDHVVAAVRNGEINVGSKAKDPDLREKMLREKWWMQPEGRKPIAIAFAEIEDFEIVNLVSRCSDNPKELADFAQVTFRTVEPDKLITYNGSGFDLPTLRVLAAKYSVGRWIHRIPVKKYDHIDLMYDVPRTFNDKWRSLKGKPNSAAALFGIESVNNVTGEEVGELWNAGEHERVRLYCQDDARITAEIFLKMAISGY